MYLRPHLRLLSGADGCSRRAGQASVWATSFEDCAGREVHRPGARTSAAGRCSTWDSPPGHRPAAPAVRRRPERGPQLRAVAVSALHRELRVLGDFENTADQLAAVRASCSDPGGDRRAARCTGPSRRSTEACWRRSRHPHRVARGRDPRARPAHREAKRRRPLRGVPPRSARSRAPTPGSRRCCTPAAALPATPPRSSNRPPAARAAGRRAARQPPGVALSTDPPHRRQRAAGRAHDGVIALRTRATEFWQAPSREGGEAARCLAGGQAPSQELAA